MSNCSWQAGPRLLVQPSPWAWNTKRAMGVPGADLLKALEAVALASPEDGELAQHIVRLRERGAFQPCFPAGGGCSATQGAEAGPGGEGVSGMRYTTTTGGGCRVAMADMMRSLARW
jgi:hypothetical protein